jgi:hypothetical protein
LRLRASAVSVTVTDAVPGAQRKSELAAMTTCLRSKP